MASLIWLDPEYVRQLMNSSCTMEDICKILAENYPNRNGMSKRSIERFCAINNIRKPFVPTPVLEQAVSTAVSEVGGTYGRKMMQGYLEHRYGLSAGQQRITCALKNSQPTYHENRRQGTQNQLNPQIYHAPYFGYNLHMDQNEKLEMYGVVYVVAVDGASFFVTSFAIMPEKNNLAIYRDIYKYTTEAYGFFEKVIVDHGKEFFLTLFVHEYLCQMPNRLSQRIPFAQVPSTKNNRIERWWVELNIRVNYPIKHCLVDMEQRGLADRSIPHHLFSMGHIVRKVAHYGTDITVGSWNAHSIPGHGKPLNYLLTKKTMQIQPCDIPTVQQAHEMYTSAGGNLTLESEPAGDLLHGCDHLKTLREQQFWLQYQTLHNHNGTLAYMFSSAANHFYVPLQYAISLHIFLSESIFSHLT